MTLPPNPQLTHTDTGVSLSGEHDGLVPLFEMKRPPATRTWEQGSRQYQQQTLRSCGWTRAQGQEFLAHLGREAIQATSGRDFKSAWRLDPVSQKMIPYLYSVTSPALKHKQYAVLTSNSYAAVLVIDIDRASGYTGGKIEALHPEVYEPLGTLAHEGFGPAWIGVNPTSGKAQAIWLIDPVYAAPGQSSPNTRLLKIVTQELTTYLGGDTSFAHRFSRWPLYEGTALGAYHWHCQHNDPIRLGDFLEKLRHMNPSTSPTPKPTEQFESGRARILAAQKATEEAKMWKALQDEEGLSVEDLAPGAAGLIEGVRPRWIIENTRAARDETAFLHALKIGHQLKKQGKPLKDAAIIDAYEHGYNIAQSIGADHREPDMPPMRDRLTMARRIRAYVTQSKAPHATTTDTRQSTAGRKALATMGSRGGKATVARRAANPEEREPLREGWKRANEMRAFSTDENKGRILTLIASHRRQGLGTPRTADIATELGLSVRRVQELRKELGLTNKPGRPPRK